MRKFQIAVMIFVLAAGVSRADTPPRTVGDFTNAMNEIADRLDKRLAQRQHVADAAAAQRLGLVSAMVRRTSAELRAAEQVHITDDASTLPAPIRAKIDAAFALALEAEARAGDEPAFVERAHSTFNALLDALPLFIPHPTYYGLLSNDLTDAKGRLPADVVIYGHRLIDRVYNEAPTVQFADTPLPASALKVSDDAVEITLTPQAKAAAHFAPPPCEPRASFGLRIHAVYPRSHGFWPLSWRTQVETNSDFYALASPDLYEARLQASAETSGSIAETAPFRRRSDYAFAECEQTRTVAVEFELPEGASDVVCKAAWRDTSGQSATNGRCEQNGSRLSASGSLTGAAKVCSPDKLCACSAHAQGVLEISGEYRLTQTTSDIRPTADLAPMEFPGGGRADVALGAGAGERLRHVKIDLGRRDCPKIIDTLDISLGDDASGSAVSKSGAFRAVYANGRLSVGSAQAFAP